MKILKIFGIVVGIHVFALLLIFANPGCSSSGKQPALADTASLPAAEPAASNSTLVTPAPAPVINVAPPASTFNPDAPAVAAPNFATSAPRQSPTRPGTPVAQTIVEEPVANVTPAETYVVKAGDNLWSIAKKHNLDYKTLATANNLPTSTILHAGQKLLIPGKVASAPAPKTKGAATKATTNGATAMSPSQAETAPASAAKTEGVMKHIVQSGEPLSVIARRYGVKTGDLALANGITDPAKVRAGTELIIPGWDAKKAAAKNGKGSAKSPTATPAPKVEAAPPPAIDFSSPPPSMAPAPSQSTFTPPVISIDPSQPPRNP